MYKTIELPPPSLRLEEGGFSVKMIKAEHVNTHSAHKQYPIPTTIPKIAPTTT